MRQRIFALLLAVCLAASLLVVPAAAVGTVRFSDVTYPDTAAAVETLRLMGVLDGYGDGSFRPAAQLNRAQFCKMAVYAMGGESELGLYRTVTVFPDVKPSHWAAAYVNLAAKGRNVIAGYPDGMFHPERPVTVGQAVTILLRLLGYKEEGIGGVWPESYLSVGATIGLTDGVGGSGNAPLSREQAARLFLNLLRAEREDGTKYLSTLGTTQEAVLASSAGGNDGKSFYTADGRTFQLTSGKTPSGILNGRTGTLLLDKSGKAVTFVPEDMGTSRTVIVASCSAKQIVSADGTKYTLDGETDTYYNGKQVKWEEAASWLHAGNTVTLSMDGSGTVTYVFVGGGSSASSAVVVYENHSSVGFDALTGGMTGYSIYKNGSAAGLGDLRKYDVATYSSTTNSIRVCDTRVTVYYEGCSPSPKEPSKITVLGGVELTVLSTAMESVSKFKPGDQMTLLLTEDGQVAGAVASGSAARGNAVGLVRDGKVRLLCGTAQIEISAETAGAFEGMAVSVSSNKSGVVLTRLTGGVSGTLNVDQRKLGGKDLAESVMIFENGEARSLSQLTSGVVEEIAYARSNWAGKVDLIVLGTADGTVYYGRAVVSTDGEAEDGTRYVKVENGGTGTDSMATAYVVSTGDYVAATVKNGRYTSLYRLTEVKNVSNAAWNGSTAVTVDGQTYRVSGDVACYNKDSGSWITLNEAHAYAERSNLYVKDGVVRVIEVKHR